MVVKNVAIIGQGYVGLPLALLASQRGHKVFGIDNDSMRIRTLSMGHSPYESASVQRDLDACVKSNPIEFTENYGVIQDRGIEDIIICVPTPVNEDKTPDLTPVIEASKSIGQHLRQGQHIVLESTVNPGVTEEVMVPILEEYSKMKLNQDFYVAHCPERINPGDDSWPLNKISRVVGASHPDALEHIVEFYESLLDIGTHFGKPYKVEGQLFTPTYDVQVMPLTSIKAAELVKSGENSFSDYLIAAANAMAQYCEARGIDYYEVKAGMETKEFSALRKYPSPGNGVGGHCIPVDPYYIIHDAERFGVELVGFKEARKINDSMPKYTAVLLSNGLNEVKKPVNGSTVAVLGVTYKPDVDDTRDTPVYPLLDHLIEDHASLRVYDPHVSKGRIPERFRHYAVDTLDDAVYKADAVIIATAHKEFRELSIPHLRENGVKVVVDGRNIISPQDCDKSDIIYKGIGRLSRSDELDAMLDRIAFMRALRSNGNGHSDKHKKDYKVAS